jgi:pyruvate kinase
MNIARLNFSHGDFSSHKKVIENIREAERATERHVVPMPAGRGERVEKYNQLLRIEEDLGSEVKFAGKSGFIRPVRY